MAIVYKTFLNSDKTTTRTLLHEAIPITGAILSGTYGANNSLGNETNLKHYSHGMFQSIYDYPYLSSSANHIIDITVGVAQPTGSTILNATEGEPNGSSYYRFIDNQQSKKRNMYMQMSQLLAGHDQNGNIRQFDGDGNYASAAGKITFPVFMNFSRLLVKDEIKKGSFAMRFGVDGRYDFPMESQILITDHGAAKKYFINSPAGEYGLLYASESGVGTSTNVVEDTAAAGAAAAKVVGMVYYQAGAVVLDMNKILSGSGDGGVLRDAGYNKQGIYSIARDGTTATLAAIDGVQWLPSGTGATYINAACALTGSSIESFANAFRRRVYNVSFNNTTELNSTVYFCRAGHNEFNHSSNPTYLTGSQIRVKNQATDMPRSYITTVGLYSADNELLAVAKLSEPIRKDPTNEVTLRVRLDY